MGVRRFYGYKHWTLEEVPRCFNVGKGLLGRAESDRHRNHKWHAVAKRLGLRVEMCLGPVTNEEACAWEIENILKEGTFSTSHSHDDPRDIGCNFTKGGEGSTGRDVSDTTRMKISRSKSGVANPKLSQILKGRPLSDDHREHIKTGMRNSTQHREANVQRSGKLKGRAPFNKGQALDADHKAAIAVGLRGNTNTLGKTRDQLRCGACGEMGHTRKSCGRSK